MQPSELNRLPRKCGVQVRQSYLRIAKLAAMMAGRHAHAKQFNRYRRQLRRCGCCARGLVG
jgi:transposase, IS5 family